MKYRLTIFKSIYDNKTHRQLTFDTWDAFESLLYKLSNQPGYKPKKDERKDGSALISPAVFPTGTTRANANVSVWGGWAALDVDTYEGHWMDAISVFRDVRYVCYSSASSTDEHPKFRVVLPLTCEVPADRIRHLWYALNKEYNGLGDPQTKDLSRMYYVPADYPGSKKFIFSNSDAPFIDPYEIMAKHPWSGNVARLSLSDKLPEEMRRKIEQYRKEKLNNTSYRWSSYSDCPFVNKRMVAEYRTIQEGGWYHMMYKIMMSIASSAMKRGYPITPSEVAKLCKDIDNDTGGWYKNRPMENEASRAIDFAVRSL
jgi:hypothetical protein